MPDPLRWALFVLSMACVVATSLAVIGPLRMSGAGALLALWVVGTGQIILLAEVLSLLHRLD